MATLTGGELVVRTLMKAGVDRIFGLHGAHIDAIFQACMDHGLPVIDCRHEAAAGHAAEGYSRTARCMGVALVTAGGGFTNAMTPLANAYLDRTPVLFITGSGPLKEAEKNDLQADINQVAIASPVTKWAYQIKRPDMIPRLLAQAIRITQDAPRGPVLIDIPWDVLTAKIDESEAPIPDIGLPVHGSAPQAGDLAAALEVLAEAKRPIMIVGSEASRSNSAPALKAFAERSGVPVFADYEGLNLLADLGDANGGLLQGLYTFKANDAAPDAVLLLGTRFGLNTAHGSGLLLPHGARIVQVDPDAREIGRLQAVELGIVAEVGASIEAFAEAAAAHRWPDRSGWRARVQELLKSRYDNVARQATPGSPMHPFEASAVVARHIDENVVVVADGALTYLWLSEVISAARPAGFLCHGFLGSMGVGFGIAVGAETAAQRAGRRTILVVGDGSVGYSIAEFDTLVRHHLPLIVVVMNNRSWGATLHFQQLAVGPNRVTNTRLENGRYQDVAKAFGADGYYVEDAAAFDHALTQALANDRPACINAMVSIEPIPPEEKVLMGQNPF